MEKKYLKLAENLFNDYSSEKFSEILSRLNAEEILQFSKAYCVAAENFRNKVRAEIAESEEKTRKAIEKRKVAEKIAEAKEKARKAMEKRNNNKVSNTNKSGFVIGLFPFGDA